jgi:hypothetical protein
MAKTRITSFHPTPLPPGERGRVRGNGIPAIFMLRGAPKGHECLFRTMNSINRKKSTIQQLIKIKKLGF